MVLLVILIAAITFLIGEFFTAVAATIFLIGGAIAVIIKLLGKAANTKAGSSIIRKINSDPKYIYFIIIGWFVLCGLLGVFIGASQPSEYDITLTPASWTEMDSFMGIEYEEKHFGFMVENTGDDILYVKVKADYYDKDGNLIDTTESNGRACLAPNQKSFVEVTVYEDETTRVEYSILEVKKAKYSPVSAGLDSTFDVYFAFDYESKEWTVTNTTKEKIEACGVQFVYYDSKGNVAYVDTVAMGDILAGKSVTDSFYPGTPYEDYETTETLTYAYYEK